VGEGHSREIYQREKGLVLMPAGYLGYPRYTAVRAKPITSLQELKGSKIVLYKKKKI
jgi:hypothetical protein